MTSRDVWVGCPLCRERTVYRVYLHDGRWWGEVLEVRCMCKRKGKHWRAMEKAVVHLGKVGEGPLTFWGVGGVRTI